MVRLIDADALIDKLESINPVDYGAMSSYETHCGARDALSDAVRYVNDAPEISLNTLRDEIYQDAVAHGLWEEAELDVNDECVRRGWEWEENLLRSACAQKIWDEAVELDEAWKSREHYSEELADVIIMSMSIAGKLGIDIDAAIRRKMEINRGRPWKHGRE